MTTPAMLANKQVSELPTKADHEVHTRRRSTSSTNSSSSDSSQSSDDYHHHVAYYADQAPAAPIEQSRTTEPKEPPPAYSDLPEAQNSAAAPVDSSRGLTQGAAGSGRLSKPVAIPATSKKLGSPFLRAYPPDLQHHQISSEVFLKFLDDLNRCAVKNPPLQILGLAAGVVANVPVWPANVVGVSVQAASTIGTVAVSKGRTELQLRQANRDIFGPQGLKCQIAKLDALAKLADIPILDAAGKVDRQKPLLTAIDPEALQRYKSGEEKVSSQQRRLAALGDYIAPLDLSTLPKLDTPSNPLSKWSAASSEKQRAKEGRRMEKSRLKASRRYNKRSDKAMRRYEEQMDELEERMSRVSVEEGEDSKKAQKMRERLERQREEIEKEFDGRMDKIEGKRTKKDKEEKGMKQILWLIIREADDVGETDSS